MFSKEGNGLSRGVGKVFNALAFEPATFWGTCLFPLYFHNIHAKTEHKKLVIGIHLLCNIWA
jgi:hypothetical protein